MPDRAFRLAISSAVLTVLSSSAVRAEASFDCGSAKTAAEKLICGDSGLGLKDIDLARIYNLAARGSAAAALRQQQTRWLAERDAQCLRPALKEEQIVCFARKYDERLAELKPRQPGATDSLALCARIADRYRAVRSKLLADPAQKEWGNKGLIDVMPRDRQSQFEINKDATDIKSHGAPDAPDALAYISKRHQPHKALRKRLESSDPAEPGVGTDADAAWVTRLPGSDIYGVSTMQGSMRCESIALFYKASGKIAMLVDDPPYADVGDCPGAHFSRAGNRPVLLVEDFSGETTARNYDLTEGYTFYPWKDGWQPACNISITYAPDLDYSGRPGTAMREAVLATMRRFQADPAGAPQKLAAELPEDRRTQFIRLKEASDAESGTAGNGPAIPKSMAYGLADDIAAIPVGNQAVALPLYQDGEVLLVLATHPLTTGSRDLPDYDVIVRAMRSGKLATVDTFKVSLGFGEPTDIKVTLR